MSEKFDVDGLPLYGHVHRMRFCTECGVHRGDQYKLGDLIVEDKPLAAFWRGDALDLRPTEVLILLQLLQSPTVGSDDMQTAFQPNSPARSVRVHISRLRPSLPPEVKINSIYGRGYSIEVNGRGVELPRTAANPTGTDWSGET